MVDLPQLDVLMVTKWPPERCGVAYYSKDLCTALSRYIFVCVMSGNHWRSNDPFLPFKTLIKSRFFKIVHFQHEYLLYGHPYFMPIFLATLAFLKLRKTLYNAPLVVVTMHSTIKIEEMTRELWRRHRCSSLVFQVQRFLAIICMKIMGSLVDKMIVHTSYAKNVLVNQYGFSISKVKVIPHGLWPRFTLNYEARSVTKKLLIFGFFRPTKKYGAIIEALRFLPTNIHLYIKGGIHPHYSDIGFLSYQTVIDLVRKLRLDERVHVELGFVNKEKSFNDVDAVILPYSELYGASGALCDAVAFSKPVLAADLPHFRSLLKSYRWLADVSDVENLTKTLVDLMNNYADALSIIDEYRRQWDWERVGQLTVKAYRESLLQDED